ncbi:hypothetical protein ACJ41O_001228 [Fusarium nematophilum]
MLLIYGGDPNQLTAAGDTLFRSAISKKTPKQLIDVVLNYGADPDGKSREGKTALFEAIQNSRVDIITTLLDHVPNNIESVKVLIKVGVDPNAKKDGVYTLLCTSIRDNRKDIFDLLISNGADPNTPASEYPAFKCITHNRLHFLPPLVAAGANLFSPKGIVETAVSVNNMEALNWLLEQ